MKGWDAPAISDGAGILVARMQLRGQHKENAVLPGRFREIAPRSGLSEWFDHDRERYGESVYRHRAGHAGYKDEVARLEDLVKQGQVTRLYAAHDEGHSQTPVLMDHLRNHTERGHGKRPP